MSANQSPDPSGDAKAFHSLLGRALVDKDFRASLSNPGSRDETLIAMGIQPSEDLSARLDTALQAVDELAEMFGPDAQAAT